MRLRLAIGTVGVLLGLFGVYRILTNVHHHALLVLGFWLIGAIVIHDGIFSPAIIAVGWVIEHTVPPRARRYLQAALIMGGLVTIIAIPMIHRRDSQPPVKAILRQNYGGNLTLLLGIIAGISLLLYALRVARDHRPKAAMISGESAP